MKKTLLSIVMLLTAITASSQIIWTPWGRTANLVDQTGDPIRGIASSLLVEGVWLNTEEVKVIRGLNALKDQYQKRYPSFALYNAQVLLPINVIDREIDNLQVRATTLRATNITNTYYFPFKRQKFADDIAIISQAITNLHNKVGGFSFPMKGGEILNLKQNLELSLEKLSRRLDDIESDMDKNTSIRRIVNSI